MTTKKLEVWTTVLDVTSYYGSLQDYQQMIADAIEKIPPECRKDAQVSVCSHEEYGDSYGRISIEYRQLETDEEAAAREAKERRSLKAQLREYEAEVARLKKLTT